MSKLVHFTDRDSQIAAFEGLWADELPWIIVFSGMSGNGKSTLIDWLIENKCKPQGIKSIKVDMNLSGGLNLPTVLSKLAVLLLPEATQRFRAEDATARQTYYRNLADLKKAEARRSVDIGMIAEGGSQISASSIRVQGDEAGEDKLRQNYHASLITAFYAEVAGLPQEQVGLFFDTFERAQDNAPGPEMALFWALLDELHQANPQLRVIVGGREDLQNQTARDWRQHEPLEVFSLADSNLFLQRWSDNQIPPDLRQAIFGLAQGHPLLTELAAEVWRDGRLAGKPLTLVELKEGLTHRSGKEWLYGRIIIRFEELGNVHLSNAARYGPLLRSFTLRSLNAILPEAVSKLDDPAFEKFTGYAFIKQTEAGWEFHELMRAAQRAYLDKKDDPEVDGCHSRAAEFFRERARATQNEDMARNALYHACFVDPAAVFDDWVEAAFDAQLSGERGWWDDLLATLEAPAQFRRLTPEQQGQLIRNRGMWHVRDYNMEAALVSYGQALDLFRAVGDRLGEANTLQAIGDVQGFKKENEAALVSYGQALDLFRAVGSRLGEANTLKAIGFMKLDTGKGEEGQNVLNEAITLYQQVGDRVGQANTYWGLGIRLAQNGNLQEAEPLIEQTLELVKQFIPNHPFTAQVETVLEQIRNSLNEQE